MPTAGVMEYTIYLPKDSQRSGYPLDLFSLILKKGSRYWSGDVQDIQPAGNGGDYIGSTVDANENLSGPSRNGIVEFKDVVNPGMLDTGDRIILRLTPTTNTYRFDSYILSFKARNRLVGGAGYFVNGHLGVLDYPSGGLLDHVQISMVNETKLSGKWIDIFRIVDVPEALAPIHRKIEWYRISIGPMGMSYCSEGNRMSVTLKDGEVCQGGTRRKFIT